MQLRRCFNWSAFGGALLVCLSSCCSWTQALTGDTEHNNNNNNNNKDKFKVYTVASERTDGYQRYLRSARVYDIEVETLGLDEEWQGGDMNHPGGGYKLNLLRKAIEPLKKEKDTIIMFTDSYDVILTAGQNEILKKFKETGAKILFGAEMFCWPDQSLASAYPKLTSGSYRFLNSGIFIGYAPQVYKMLEKPIDNKDDDQLYFTKIFLNEELRKELGMQLDTKAHVIQNLNGAKDHVKLNVNLDTNVGTLENVIHDTRPHVIHGNGPSKIDLNAYGNYLANTFDGECRLCREGRIELKESDLPSISLAVIVNQDVPFFDVFLKKIENLNYPKDRLHLFIFNGRPLHESMVQDFYKRLEKVYRSAKMISSSDMIDERRGRQLALQMALQRNSDYLFSIDADVHADDPEMLRELLIVNKSFVSCVISKYNELWSNFWGALSDSGYYARSHDYVDIVKRDIVGMWNVPYVSGVYLIKSNVFKHIKYEHPTYDPDMALCESLRNAGVFMYIVNSHKYGHLVNTDDFDTTVMRPDFYTLFSNKLDWTDKYINPNYYKQLEDNVTLETPCPDVYWLQIATDAFCDDLVAIMENYGKWSDGSNKDNRLEGGYEAVPTRDIHMKQVGLDAVWLKFLQIFVRPLQEKVFMGYYHNPPRSYMNFVVRYRPDEQPFLRPHHDSSTYTINIALNRAGIDFEGGGCRFLRYNCSITATKKGWMLMHPGRLTHFHEGLLVTKGTRYIMISFIDP